MPSPRILERVTVKCLLNNPEVNQNNNNLHSKKSRWPFKQNQEIKSEVGLPVTNEADDVTREAKETLLVSAQVRKAREHRCNRTIKYAQTAAIYGIFFSFAFTINLLGPTLLHLAARTHTNVVRAATLFMWRGIGALIGGLVFGRLLDAANPFLVLLLLGATCSVVTAAVPWSGVIEVTSTLFALQGFFVTAISIGSNICVFSIWRQSRGLVHQTLHFLFPVAGLITPQLISLYTPPLVQPTVNVNVTSRTLNLTSLPSLNEARVSSPYVYGDMSSCEQMASSPLESCNTTELGLDFNVTDTLKTVELYDSKVGYKGLIYAYTINAGLLAICTIPFLLLVVRKSTRTFAAKLQYKDVQTVKNRRVSPGRLMQGLFVVTACLVGAMETAFNGLVIPFAVEFLKWPHGVAANLLSARFAAYCAARLLVAVASKQVRPSSVIAAGHVVTVTSCLVLSAVPPSSPVVLWTFSLLASFSVAPYFATYLLWAGEMFPVTGVFTSVYVMGQGIGNLVSPPLVAALCQRISYTWFLHTQTVMALLIASIYVVIVMASYRYKDQFVKLRA